MKLTSTLVLLASFAPAFAQSAKPAVHRSTSGTHRTTAASACADLPTLGADIPKIAGCPKTLYALRYIDTLIGSGPLAMPLKLYTVHYTGYLTDGKKFDSSVDRKDPIVFPAGVHRVITGWDTGFEGMHVGGKRRLFIPYELAYGDAGKPPTIPAKSMLVFDVELIAQADFPQQPPPGQRSPGSPNQPGTTPGSTPGSTPGTPATPPSSTPSTTTPPSSSNKPAPDGAKPATVPGADPTKPTTVLPPTSTPSSPTTVTPPPTTQKP